MNASVQDLGQAGGVGFWTLNVMPDKAEPDAPRKGARQL